VLTTILLAVAFAISLVGLAAVWPPPDPQPTGRHRLNPAGAHRA